MNKSVTYQRDKLNKVPAPTLKTIRKIRARIRNIHEVKIFLARLIILVGFIALIFYGLFGVYAVSNDEMTPRISPGDLLLIFRPGNIFLADDIIVYQVEGEKHVGRVVAKEGDSVEIKSDGGLYINDNYKLEKEIYSETYSYKDYVDYPVKLEEGQYFVLGDNRENALDSRYYGPVSGNQIVGKAISLIRRGKL